MNGQLKKSAILVVKLMINLATVAILAFGLVLLQRHLPFSGAFFSHYEFLGLAIALGIGYLAKVYKSSSITFADFILFTCFSITSLAVVVLFSFTLAGVELAAALSAYAHYGIAAWITLGVVATAAQRGWKFKSLYLYAWFVSTIVSAYLATLLLTILNPMTHQVGNLMPALTLSFITLLLLLGLIRRERPVK